MSRRNAFTLIELLVVVAVIGILIGLLLPAIQAAREAARRMACSSNLKQIGLALHGHHSAKNAFPPGNEAQTAGVCPGGSVPGVDNPSEDRANWMIRILPYLERKALHEAYNFQVPNEDPANQRVRESSVAAYVCPADLGPDALQVPAMGPAASWALNVPYMPGSYRAVSGRSDGHSFLDSPEFTNYRRAWRGPIHLVGVLGYGVERIKNITDGTSNTLLVGESTTATNPGYRTLWAYSFAHYSLSAVTPQARVLYGDYDRCRAESGDGLSGPCRRGWGSPHPGGLHFLLCDGSVRFFDQDIDPELLAQLATIAGGEAAAVPE